MRGLVHSGWWVFALAALLGTLGCSSDEESSDGCSSNAECTGQVGGPAVCRGKQCVALTSDLCTDVSGDLEGTDPLVLGGMTPIIGEFASLGFPIKEGWELAFEELGKLPIGGADRSIVVVTCHDIDTPEVAAQHLVDVVGVPAILGPAFSGVTITTAQNVTIPGGVLLMSPSATSPAITDLSDNDLVWRDVASDALQAIPLASLVKTAEQKVRTALGLAATDKVKLAMTVKQDAYGLGIAESVTPLVELNGQPLTGEDPNFLRVEYADPEADPNVDYNVVVNEVTTFAPHILMALGTNEIVTRIMTGVETGWVGNAPRPQYLLPDGGRVTTDLDAAIGTDDDLRLRVLGTVPGRQGASYAAFASRFQAKFSKAPDTFAENGYDAGYLLAYAAVATGGADGAAIASGLRKLVAPGTALEIAPDTIQQALAGLAGGGSLDVNGVSGTLDFDAKGDVKTDIDVWCVTRDSGGAILPTSSGQYYSATTGVLEGTISCP